MSTIESSALPRFVPVDSATAPSLRSGRRARPHRRESLVLFVVFGLIYLAVAGALASAGIIFVDSLSRVANAYYALFSRYPHLPAIGFVWNPLPSISVMPLLPLKGLFPALVTKSLASGVQSALCMAGANVAIYSCLRKLGVRRTARLVMIALVGLQPMILLYGGSGESEPMLLLFLALTASSLISWMQDRQPGSLVSAGVSLGLAYLARYEAVAVVLAVLVLVGLVSFVSARGSRADRFRPAINDVVLVAAPAAFAFALWAVSAKLLVGHWLPTFSSQYGNAAQVADSKNSIEGATGTSFGSTLRYIVAQTLVLSPSWLLLLLIAVVLAVRRRDPVVLVAVAVFGAVMAFDAAVLLNGSSFGWLRFQIAVIPLTALLAGSVIGRRTAAGDPAPADDRPKLLLWQRFCGPAGIGPVGLVLLAAAIPVQALVITDPGSSFARQEGPVLGAIFHPGSPGVDPTALHAFETERQVSRDIDALALPTGAVLTDSAFAFAVVVDSARPTTYVINSDVDFAADLADPAGHHVRYLLVSAHPGSDALQVRWPTLFQDGAGIAVPVRTWVGPSSEWRLFRVR